jgi:long-chain acyl-CoA synthetase
MEDLMKTLFVTGVTGFLGRYTAVRLLRRPSVDRVICLVRAESKEHGHERLLKSLARAASEQELGSLMDRVEALPGDLMKERLGLSADQWADVARRTDGILHCAADVRFNRDLEESRLYNVLGTERVLELAKAAAAAGGLRRFDYISTTYVAGLRRDLVLEDELQHDAGWKNPYEQTKYEAEMRLRELGADLPLTVFRPSIIVGESETGATTNFGMLYWPLRIYALGWWRTIIGRPETPLDIVPVDFVADAIEALSRPDSPVGGNYHLAAGPDGILTIAELVALTEAFFGGRPARYMTPKTFWRWGRPVADMFVWGPKRKIIREGGKFFIPYFDGNPIFDVARSHGALAELGVTAPKVGDYFETILDYCKRTNFGKTLPEGVESSH